MDKAVREGTGSSDRTQPDTTSSTWLCRKAAREVNKMPNRIEYFKVTESGFPPEFARIAYTENGQRLEVHRKGAWVDGTDLGDVFFKGKGMKFDLKILLI